MYPQSILGLDPAGYLFEDANEKYHLDKSDANFVDVIHTNGESLAFGGLGIWKAIGHVDFYPNGGKSQRGCQNLFVGGVKDLFDGKLCKINTQQNTLRCLINVRRTFIDFRVFSHQYFLIRDRTFIEF